MAMSSFPIRPKSVLKITTTLGGLSWDGGLGLRRSVGVAMGSARRGGVVGGANSAAKRGGVVGGANCSAKVGGVVRGSNSSVTGRDVT